MASTIARDTAYQEIDNHADDLNALSKSIWGKPELNFGEKHAHEVLTSFLEKHGFAVERHFKLDTAFKAVYVHGKGGPNVAIMCEYDALPEIGHACGHNLIAEAGVATGLGVKAALKACDLKGKVTVLGTPAEEDGGGKIDLIRANVFDDVDVAMMAHPTPVVSAFPFCLSIAQLKIKFHGKAAHAAGFPWEGINALDAAVLCYQNLSCLRQQMKPNWRLHGIISNGGTKPNVIPELTELDYYLRAPTDAELNILKEKVNKCVEGAAQATGCKVDYGYDDRGYSNVITNKVMGTAFEKHAKALGVQFTPEEELAGKPLGSTDMGNVSYVVPSIHPMYFIGTKGVANHTREFTAASGSPAAQPYTLDVSKALAMTALDVLSSSDILDKIKADFKADLDKNKGKEQSVQSV